MVIRMRVAWIDSRHPACASTRHIYRILQGTVVLQGTVGSLSAADHDGAEEATRSEFVLRERVQTMVIEFATPGRTAEVMSKTNGWQYPSASACSFPSRSL